VSIQQRLNDKALTDRLFLTGAIAMFPAGFAALLASALWWPLVYLFWVVWPLNTYWMLTKTRIGLSRCGQCLSRVPVGATRCRKCTQPLE